MPVGVDVLVGQRGDPLDLAGGDGAARSFVRKTWVGPRTKLGGATSGWTGLVLGWRTTSPRSRVAHNGTLPSRGTAARIWSARRGRPLRPRRAKLQEYPAYLQEALVGRQCRRAARQVGHDGTRRRRLAAVRRAGREVGSRGRHEGSRGRRRTRRANAPCSRTLMEILNWVTRRPRTDEMLRLDRATTRTSTRRRPDARHALAFRGERSASPSLLAFWEALR
jgi:hypothetical protein